MFSSGEVIEKREPNPIARIRPVLNHVEFLEQNNRPSELLGKVAILRFRLMNLTVFVLSARKLGSNESLKSLLVRIKDTVTFHAPGVYAITSDWSFNYQNLTDLSQLIEAIQSYERYIQKCLPGLKGSTETLKEQMIFLKNLTLFSTMRSVEHTQDLLDHAEAVAIVAARLILKCSTENFEKKRNKELQVEVSKLLQKIKPIEPEVYNMYTKALRSSKLQPRPTQDMDDETFTAMRNFLDSLISSLWEVLQQNTCHVVAMKDQLQELYERLRSLRIILKQQPFSSRIEIKEDIRVVVCDTGILICSLYQKNEVADLGVHDLLQTIKDILAEAGEKDPQVPTFNFPMTNQLGFVDFLLEKLVHLEPRAEPTVKSCVQSILDELVFLRSFLEEIVNLRKEQEVLQALWDRVLEVTCKVECLIDVLAVGDIQKSFTTSSKFIIKDLQNIKADVHDKRQEIEIKEVSRNYSNAPSRRAPSTTKNEVVGFDNDARSIVDQLIRGTNHLRIFAIVGMPGLGKTTLAAKVYDDHSIVSHFHVRAWCPISQEVHKKKIFLELLNHIDPNNENANLSEQDLEEKLWRSLKGKRYLFFLDDIWNVEVWNNLGRLFPDDNKWSRIILTSRLHDIVPREMLLDGEPHSLRQLNVNESLELLQRKLFPGNDEWPPEVRHLGMQIAEKCKGLPLTIVIVAGILATKKLDGWRGILDELNSGSLSMTEHCKSAFELSYKHLPDCLRPCFLYFGAFPEDQKVSSRRLLRLWIAEGLVQKSNMKSVEDTAEDHLKDLIRRSLIMVAKQSWDGGVKACRVHDLLHEFCSQKAKDEYFFHFLKGYDELLAFKEPLNLRRLCIESEPNHFKESKLFCPQARSLLFNSSQRTKSSEGGEWLPNIAFVIHVFKLLRVLDLEQLHLSNGLPKEIEMLVQLAFLAIRGDMEHMPSSLGKLSNLETLILNPYRDEFLFPNSIWDLQKLKYLYIKSSTHLFPGGILPIKDLDSSPVLQELDTLSGAIIPEKNIMEKLMRKFPNIRKLKCKFFLFESDPQGLDKIVVPDFLSRLESLRLSNYIGKNEISLPVNLKKLTLSGFFLSMRNISTIGELLNLEVLKLLDVSFEGELWELTEGEFINLRTLKLSSWYLEKWTACDDQFISLQKLVLRDCRNLEEMPSCVGDCPMLETIEVLYCRKEVQDFARHIEEQQLNLGNEGLKVIIKDF